MEVTDGMEVEVTGVLVSIEMSSKLAVHTGPKKIFCRNGYKCLPLNSSSLF